MTACAALAAVVAVCVAGLAGACAGGDDGVEPVATSSCGELLYEGEGEPDVILVSDNPRRGEHAAATEEVVDAIEFVLRQRDYRAGEFRVGFQSCDDTVGGNLDAGQCRRNARAYVETRDVVGVIGPYNSGCAELQIPIVSRTAAGPLAMVSPANTDEGLTRGPRALPLYPGRRPQLRARRHARPGAGSRGCAHRETLGAQRAAVIAQRGVDDPYVSAADRVVRRGRSSAGDRLEDVHWLLEESYADLAASIAAARPDVVYLVGLPQGNAKTLIRI